MKLFSIYYLFLLNFVSINYNNCREIIKRIDNNDLNADNECYPGICDTRRCEKVDKCPEKFIIVLDKCECCVECEKPSSLSAPGNSGKPPVQELCLPGDCDNKICDDIKYCPNNYIMTIDQCGCCKHCAQIKYDGEKCDENAQKNNKEVCVEGTECIFGRCTCQG